MNRLVFVVLLGAFAGVVRAAPPPPTPGDVYGWELPKLVSIDTIEFPKRLVRNRSYGRVVAEISLRRDGVRQDIVYTHVDNGDLTRWAAKILESATFTAAGLDGSPLPCRLPAHVLFAKAEGDRPPHYEVWLPGDDATHGRCLEDHFLAINNAIPPLLLRAGIYDRAPDMRDREGMVLFEVHVNRDGSREEGRLVESPGDDFARQALSAMVDLQILPPRFRGSSYGSWVRIQVGFFDDWRYPSRAVDRDKGPYRGWPAPVISPVGGSGVVPPLFQSVDLTPADYNRALLLQAGAIVSGHAIYCARVDTLGRVAEWVEARPVEEELLRTDAEYAGYGRPPDADSLLGTLRSYSSSELARLAGVELERILPHMVFTPARAADGRPLEMWVAVTPAIFR
jgi:hypothetical protein